MPASVGDDDFLLTNETARVLFHQVAEGAPVVDFHTHLAAADVAADRRYETLTDLWLGDDHYKWRAMRLAGIDERLVTGDADPWDRFRAWAATLPGLVGNPLQVWTQLELRRVFGIDLLLTPASAREIWDEANRQLPRWSARSLLARFNVAVLATTDDPGDDLAAHRQLRSEVGAAGPARLRVVPTWRPDPVHGLMGHPEAWNGWVDRVERATGLEVGDLASLLAALRHSHARFAAAGSRASDHGLRALADQAADRASADSVIRRLRRTPAAEAPTPGERAAVETEVIALGAELAHAADTVQQLHLGARRDLSPRLLAAVGPDAGADAIGDDQQGPGLARFLSTSEAAGHLPRTVLYNLNPADNALFATVAGSFSRPGVPGLVQWGPPWWFNDHEHGMRRQLRDLGQVGRLAGFVGMVADSRSIVSITRHELFRRVLCDTIGRAAADGAVQKDLEYLSEVVRGICFENALAYFGFGPLAS